MRTLTETKPSLPGTWYFDPGHYKRELAAIWHRDWICVGRAESLARVGDYFVANIGDQSIVVTRSANDQLHAFHNTCRHRGAALCAEDAGHFRNGRMICPYHTWTYSLQGELIATPGRFETDDFCLENYALYAVHVELWRGFVFINLAQEPAVAFANFSGQDADLLGNWPLEDMRSVHQETVNLACNWKLFWENYSECYHCPRIHPELCKVMPVYRKGVFDFADLPDWTPDYEGDRGLGMVGDGARTWSMDGELSLPPIEGLTDAEIKAGVVFASFPSSLYVVGHPDYVRSVRMRPTGPESIELVVDWLLPAAYEIDNPQQIQSIVALAKLVLSQDGAICETNQRGQRSNRHEAGVLTPQEYELWEFHEGIRDKLER
jgi:Rieske 2Fe-2S family protein